MGQQEVMDVLKENKDWMSREDISKITGLSVGTIGSNVTKLLRSKEIKIRKSPRVSSKRGNQYNDKTHRISVTVHEYKII